MDAVDLLRTLVAFDTTPRRSNLPLVEWVAGYLADAGARIRLTRDDGGAKANVLATFGPDAPGGVVLSAHTDVVPVTGQDWTSDPFTLIERDGRLYGRGTADMKGFIAACLAAVPRWSGSGLRRPVHLALSYDEESGCLGVPRLIADLVGHVPRPALAIVGEPTGLGVADRHRGYLGFRTVFHGRAAHSSDPGRGVSAITAAARFVGRLEALRRERPGPGGTAGTEATTVNAGTITGGTAMNIVPARCEVGWEIRPGADAALDDLRALTAGLLDGEPGPPDTEEILTIPPLRPEPGNPAVELARRLGDGGPPAYVPFGTEAGLFQAAGIPAAVCGPGSIDQAHRPDEWIDVRQLTGACRFLEGVTQWARTPAG